MKTIQNGGPPYFSITKEKRGSKHRPGQEEPMVGGRSDGRLRTGGRASCAGWRCPFSKWPLFMCGQRGSSATPLRRVVAGPALLICENMCLMEEFLNSARWSLRMKEERDRQSRKRGAPLRGGCF